MVGFAALRLQQLRRELQGWRIDSPRSVARLLRAWRPRVPAGGNAIRADALLVLSLPRLARPRARQRRAAHGRVQVPNARGCVLPDLLPLFSAAPPGTDLVLR